jgi:hypothetical protein
MELPAGGRQIGLGVLLAIGALGQNAAPPEPPASVLTYTGKPLKVPFQCTGDDIQWAGLSCSEDDPCPVYLELTAVESIGNQLFVTGNIHSQTVTFYSLFLGSADGGSTWREAYRRMRGTGLDHIQFADFENGWASGEALSPLPQDPFLLMTSDGGKTWRQHPIFSETRVGSIQQFFFNSKKDGSLVIDRGQGSEGDRYELYESPNAGESWSIKEANRRPIQLKTVPASPLLWRVQADGATQAYRVERQMAGRWTAAASFSVDLGACVPARQPAAEPTAAPPAQEPKP